MGRIFLAVVALSVAGCASPESMACRRANGMEPGIGYALLLAPFGAVGGAVAGSIINDLPEHQAWRQRVDDCIRAKQQEARR